MTISSTNRTDFRLACLEKKKLLLTSTNKIKEKTNYTSDNYF